jgi:TRAP-type uncharacterized transport system fused permease subunit
MNELDDTLAQLFAQDEPDAASEAFAAAVRRRIARHRTRAKAVEIALAAAIVVGAGALIVLAPGVLLYPVQRLNELLSSPLGAIACVLGAIGLSWWSRYGDA